MSAAVQSWIERASGHAGVWACGARLADRSFLARTCSTDIAEAQVAQALREIWEAMVSLQQNHLPVQHLRWSLGTAQFRCVVRPGGVMGALLVAKESADEPAIEQLLAEFNP